MDCVPGAVGASVGCGTRSVWGCTESLSDELGDGDGGILVATVGAAVGAGGLVPSVVPVEVGGLDTLGNSLPEFPMLGLELGLDDSSNFGFAPKVAFNASVEFAAPEVVAFNGTGAKVAFTVSVSLVELSQPPG